MRHKHNKLLFHLGHKANKALTRKLLINFIKYGHIETTHKKAKILKQSIDKLVYKAIKNQQSDYNSLLKSVNNISVIKYLINTVATANKTRVGGYVKIKKKKIRFGDGALITRMTWVEQIPAMINPPKKQTVKKDSKQTAIKNEQTKLKTK